MSPMTTLIDRVRPRVVRMPNPGRGIAAAVLGIFFVIGWLIGITVRGIWALGVWLAAAFAQGYTEGRSNRES